MRFGISGIEPLPLTRTIKINMVPPELVRDETQYLTCIEPMAIVKQTRLSQKLFKRKSDLPFIDEAAINASGVEWTVIDMAYRLPVSHHPAGQIVAERICTFAVSLREAVALYREQR